MTLSFTQTIGGKPNYFIEKIWDSMLNINHFNQQQLSQYQFDHFEQFGFHWDGQTMQHDPKLHTIREDKHDRWKAGMLIHPVINNRTPQRFQFAPVMKCVSVQSIEIKYTKSSSGTPLIYIEIDRKCFGTLDSENNCKSVYPAMYERIQQLAINDGFDSVEAFLAYFSKDFTGKIIHWTDLRY
jgi:hypothetical protein